MGHTIVNNPMYADDLVLLCPYSAGLQQMLKVCSQYGLDYDIKHNQHFDCALHEPLIPLHSECVFVCVFVIFGRAIVSNSFSQE